MNKYIYGEPGNLMVTERAPTLAVVDGVGLIARWGGGYNFIVSADDGVLQDDHGRLARELSQDGRVLVANHDLRISNLQQQLKDARRDRQTVLELVAATAAPVRIRKGAAE